uniref:von Willebrand factor A domain-containing protein 5A n=2 Tax=Trichobilharzia regenti TaxID=157069 RepID=A0AA85K0E3_TRIRE|nr:unnamed protein product [Trichobilharzia regenti]
MNAGWNIPGFVSLGLVCQREYVNVPLKSIKIKCKIVNMVADVEAVFTYENSLKDPLEATFIFPLNDASVYHFEAQIGNKKIVSVCRPRPEAKETYDSAVEEGHTAILAEQNEHCSDVFQMNIGNIPPNGTVILVLRYVNILDGKNVETDEKKFSHAEITLTLPSVINPRYSPKEQKIPSEFEGFTEPVLVNSVPYTITFEAELSMSSKILDVKSTHDRFILERSGDVSNANVKLASEFIPNHDLQMVISLSDSLKSLASLEYGDTNESSVLATNCLMVQFLPEFPEVNATKKNKSEIVFLIDRSGSMQGDNISYAKTSLLLFLKSLPVKCRFQIIGFGSHFDSLFPEPRDYSEESLNQALKYQEALDADMGGTEVYNALKSALNSSTSGEGCFKQIIFLTDGDVNNADEVIGLVRMNSRKARVFAIGLGEGASTGLVKGVARAGNGTAAFVRDNSQLHSTVMRILTDALQPEADNVSIEWKLTEKLPDGKETPIGEIVTVPKQIAPLFSGHFVTYFGYFKSDKLSTVGGQVNLNYSLLGEKKTLTLNVSNAVVCRNNSNSSQNLPIHRLAGNVQINELVDEYHSIQLAEKDETHKIPLEPIRQQVEDLSCRLNILTKFTAMVAVDPEKLDTNEKTKRVKVSVPLMRRSCGGAPYATMAMGMPMANCGIDMIDFASPTAACCLRNDMTEAVCYSGSLGFEMNESVAAVCVEEDTSNEKVEKHIQLAKLQSFSGSWNFNTSLCECFGVPMDDLSTCLKEPGKSPFLTETTWATALAIAYLESYIPEKKDEWCLLVEKAKNWLLTQAESHKIPSKKPSELCDELIVKAKDALTKLLKKATSS